MRGPHSVALYFTDDIFFFLLNKYDIFYYAGAFASHNPRDAAAKAHMQMLLCSTPSSPPSQAHACIADPIQLTQPQAGQSPSPPHAQPSPSSQQGSPTQASVPPPPPPQPPTCDRIEMVFDRGAVFPNMATSLTSAGGWAAYSIALSALTSAATSGPARACGRAARESAVRASSAQRDCASGALAVGKVGPMAIGLPPLVGCKMLCYVMLWLYPELFSLQFTFITASS